MPYCRMAKSRRPRQSCCPVTWWVSGLARPARWALSCWSMARSTVWLRPSRTNAKASMGYAPARSRILGQLMSPSRTLPAAAGATGEMPCASEVGGVCPPIGWGGWSGLGSGVGSGFGSGGMGTAVKRSAATESVSANTRRVCGNRACRTCVKPTRGGRRNGTFRTRAARRAGWRADGSRSMEAHTDG